MASLIPAGISLLGGVLSNNSQNSANSAAAEQAAFNPFNISGAGGNVNFQNGAVNATGDAQSQMFANLFGGNTQNLLSGGAGNQGTIDFANSLNFGNLFGQAGQAGNAGGAINAANQFGQFSGINSAFGQQGGINALAQANQFGGAQTGINEGQAQGLFSAGNQALGNTDFNSIAANQLQRSRALARPQEEAAVNSKFQNLFSRGILSSTSGSNQIAKLAGQQESADIQRQQGADQFANQIQQQNRQFGLGAIGQGFQGRQQDTAGNLGRGNLFAGLGQNLLGFGQDAAGQQLGSQFNLSNLINSRGQERLANAGNIFGFGQQAQGQNFGQALSGFGVNTQINADLRNLIALGGNLGQSGAEAGAEQGRFTSQTGGSPLGSFLSGLGGNEAFGSLFS